jgi:hypothetical protein
VVAAARAAYDRSRELGAAALPPVPAAADQHR